MVIITDTETPQQMALKIFKDFEVGQSCTVTGFMHVENNRGTVDVVDKGQLVLNEIARLDTIYNCFKTGSGKKMRNVKKLPNSIGGTIAHKIFRWQKVITNSSPRYSIWRFQ